MEKEIRVRFAPSPTGYATIGSARTALYNYLFAHQQKGKYILRIEDTDRERYVADSVRDLMSSMKWLGIEADEDPEKGGPYAPYIQTQRLEIYHKYSQKLIEENHAYYCFCSKDRLEKLRQEQELNHFPPRYDRLCRDLPKDLVEQKIKNGEPHVIRFKTPLTGITKVTDIARGEIEFENTTLDDFIIVKSDGLPVYHLAAMVDDGVMKISHVIRGLEWLPSLPKHVLLLQALGFEQPQWLHLSLFLKPSGKGKMSKRDFESFKDSGYAIHIKEMDRLGYLPQAILNWIVLMGWSLDDKTEIMSLSEMIAGFSLDHVHASPAAIDFKRLDYFNGHYIRALSQEDLEKTILSYLQKYEPDYFMVVSDNLEKFKVVTTLIRERLRRFDEFKLFTEYFLLPITPISIEQIIEFIADKDVLRSYLSTVITELNSLSNWEITDIDSKMHQIQTQFNLKPKEAFMTIRLIVSGSHATPPLFDMLKVIGKEAVIERINQALSNLS